MFFLGFYHSPTSPVFVFFYSALVLLSCSYYGLKVLLPLNKRKESVTEKLFFTDETGNDLG